MTARGQASRGVSGEKQKENKKIDIFGNFGYDCQIVKVEVGFDGSGEPGLFGWESACGKKRETKRRLNH